MGGLERPGLSPEKPAVRRLPMRRILSIALIWLWALPVLRPQTTSHEEEAVRNSYAKLSYVCELAAISPVAFDRQLKGQDQPRRSDLDLLVALTTPHLHH